jgi:hypothetical protein
VKKTTIVILPQHRAAYEAYRREQPSLSLTQFYSDAMSFYLRHGNDATLKPAIKAQQELIQRLDATLKILANPPPLVDHTRLELHAKHLAGEVSASVQHLERGVTTAAIQAIGAYRATLWRLAIGAFALGAMVGVGCLSLSRILW